MLKSIRRMLLCMPSICMCWKHGHYKKNTPIQHPDHITLQEFTSNCISSCTDTYIQPLFHFLLNTCICVVTISILKHVCLYPGLVLHDKSSSKSSSPLRTVLRVSRIHSKLLSVIHQHFIPCFLRPIESLLCNYN